MPGLKSLLITKNLNVGYAEKTVASCLNLAFQPGTLHAIIGVNGIGKTTLLNTLAQQLQPISGEIFIKGTDCTSIPTTDLAKEIGIVFTHRSFSQNLTVYDFIALGRHPYTNFLGRLGKNDKAEIEKAIKLVQIENFAGRTCVSLSDGQLQKVLIARVLAQDTPIILMDEPTHHLDFYNRAFVMRLLKQLTREFNKCIVFSTHEINMALQLSDDIVLLNQKEYVQNNPKSLINSGVLENIFPQDQVSFDKEKGVFKIRD